MSNQSRTVTLTTASGHQFAYHFDPVKVANALVRLEQSQLHAEKKAALQEMEQESAQKKDENNDATQ